MKLSHKKGLHRLGHIPFSFDSFGCLVHHSIQDYILIDGLMLEGYGDGIS